jgi:endonuclease/exonuclease/phosphatase family metal-dependent hydrolase
VQEAIQQLEAETGLSATMDHNLRPFFPELGRFNSTRALHASAVYKKLRPEIERVLQTVVQGDLASEVPTAGASIRTTAWNIERGTHLEPIMEILGGHSLIGESDLYLLTELDLGMARSYNRDVTREIGQTLGLNYVFAPCYIALNKGSGLEDQVPGENLQALHGNALFSRHPLRDAHSIALPNGKDLMRGKEKRLGSQCVVMATVDHPLGSFRAVCLHLDAQSSQQHRGRQMKIVLDHLKTLSPSLPVLLGGDWNTSTYNSSRAVYSILGYCRRVLMGVNHVIDHHYTYPDRWFERHLFRELKRQGYHYQDLNEPGVCSLHYQVDDLAANNRMGDWVPAWCFWFINWALQKNDGCCSIKLDWFAGKDITADGTHPPRVVSDVHPEELMLSDHDPIVLDFVLGG